MPVSVGRPPDGLDVRVGSWPPLLGAFGFPVGLDTQKKPVQSLPQLPRVPHLAVQRQRVRQYASDGRHPESGCAKGVLLHCSCIKPLVKLKFNTALLFTFVALEALVLVVLWGSL